MKLPGYGGRPAPILAAHPWRWPFVTRLDLGDTPEARAHWAHPSYRPRLAIGPIEIRRWR